VTGGQGIVTGDSTVGRARDGCLLAWGVVGVVAQAAFMAGWLIAETWQGPRYSPVKYTISDLQAATAPHAWFPIACFAAGGLGTFGFAGSGCAGPGRGREGRRLRAVDAGLLRAGSGQFLPADSLLADPG
jgi:hypothetical protein